MLAGEALIKLKIGKTEMTDGVILEVQFVSIYPFTTTEISIGDTGEFEETRIANRKVAFLLRRGISLFRNNLNIRACNR